MVIVVGMGPSLGKLARGREIDKFPNIVRMPDFKRNAYYDYMHYNKRDHGERTDYIVAAAQLRTHVIEYDVIPRKATWIYGRPGAISREKETHLKNYLGKYKPVVCRESDRWLNRFVEMGARSLPRRIPIPQTGIIGTIIAIEKLKPKQVFLAGLDSFWDESQGMRYNHDMNTTRRLMHEIIDLYEIELVKF